MNNSILQIAVTMVIIFLIIVFSIFLTEIQTIVSLGVRVENSLVASGWAGFSKLDLNKMAERIQISDEEERELYLDKVQAEMVVRDYIKINLNLDENYYPTADSYIAPRAYPLIIEEITIYNPDDLPAVTTDGISINRTTIHIVVLIPMDIKFAGLKYVRKSTPVDIKSFY